MYHACIINPFILSVHFVHNHALISCFSKICPIVLNCASIKMRRKTEIFHLVFYSLKIV